MDCSNPRNCRICRGRGKVFSLQPLLMLVVGIGTLVWLYLAFTDMRGPWLKVKNVPVLLLAIVLGPLCLWMFISRGVLSRKGWSVECPLCRDLRLLDAIPGDEQTGVMIEASVPCPYCRYDLRHQPVGGRCPECGAGIVSPKAMSRMHMAREGRRSTLIAIAACVGAAAVLALATLFVAPAMTGLVGVGSLLLICMSLGAADAVMRKGYFRGVMPTGWTMILYASCFLLVGLMIIASILWAIFG